MNSFLQTLKNLGPVRLASLGAVAVASLLFFTFLMARIGGDPMTSLYSKISAADGGAIIERLEQMNIPYEASADGTRISVPTSEVGRVKMILSQEGLPVGGGVGYEIFNQPEGFGTTSFLQNINQQRAMEGELARTIRTLQPIASARVQLVLPRRELFAKEAQQARASVFVEMKAGAIADRELIKSITHLVSSAVPQLAPGHVAIIDSRGNLLAAGTGDDSISAQQQSIEQQRMNVETRLAQRVEEILGRTVGYDKVRAQVSVELDMEAVTEQAETYDPESQVARSTQSVLEKNETSEPNPADASVTVANNLPSGDNTAGTSATITTGKNSRTEETTNFEISKTVQNKVRQAGGVKRLTVAVLVDGTYKTEGEGAEAKQIYQPRSQEDIDQYLSLVRNAVGYDGARGDTVEVVNLQFAQDVVVSEPDALSTLTDNPQLMRLAEVLVMSLMGILAFLLVVRPMVRGLLEVKQEADAQLTADKAAGQLTGPSSSAIAQQLDAAEAAMEEAAADSMIDINRVDGRVKASSLKKMGEIIDKHPEEAVAIIRQWIYAET
jgi:flagellar M-ring protein FliF